MFSLLCFTSKTSDFSGEGLLSGRNRSVALFESRAPLADKSNPTVFSCRYSSPRFSYSVQPVAVASAPVARYAPAPYNALPSIHVAGPSNVHTSVSTPYHSYSY